MIPIFRAWDIDRKRMLYMEDGLLVAIDNDGIIVKNIISLIDISNFELMQALGLKDSNGKEIYGKDIVKDYYGELYVVEWIEGAFILKEFYNGGYDYFYLESSKSLKIVGNVYENSELNPEILLKE